MDRGQPKCACHKGYSLNADGRTCDDINECTTHRHKCSQICHNLDGSYTCSCQPGFNLSPDQTTCEDIDECGLINEAHCEGSLEICINTMGSFRCECQDGFHRVNDTCQESLPSTNGPTGTTGIVASSVSIALTIKDADLHEWQARLFRMFMDAVAEVVVDYCKGNANGNCYGNAVIAKR
ncbi:PREDICTED: mucin-like protein isoform X2 [Acropora digitifera]|nr:PREDICTED: mucin-like protein isoform X2 [Acropora digitifera]